MESSAAAVNPRTSTIYVANHMSDTVSLIAGPTNTVVATITVGAGPQGLTVNPRTNSTCVTNFAGNTFRHIMSFRRYVQSRLGGRGRIQIGAIALRR
jgi:YVTN family beta-propeller protein